MDELIKTLRQIAHGCGGSNVNMPMLLDKVADAIEELTRENESLAKSVNEASEILRRRWIPVTERLPNGEAERYLIAASWMPLGLWVSICYYADNLEEVDEYDFKDEKHGGFYGYDDEYGYYEKGGVQYWMPLPEPPKEDI